jgi:putative heme-binding domain-containing protein
MKMRTKPAASLLGIASVILLALAPRPVAAQKPGEPIPHGQDRLPGPPLSPAEAIRKMTVPAGFTVELVASEPDIINPVAMTFDERGRIWITESLEYPRRSAGPGRDRVKVLESTKGDGKYDKITVFADGLNIPSGIAVGHGGVWVANSPDILFLQDTKGDGKCDRREVVVTGFGRSDTHELPNSLTWGPDGYLYGLNGVFNASHVRQGGKDFRFTCAMFRIHPRTRQFELFCEGTSNPWGIAWDAEGNAFVSACVIDHLWHLTETGYYLRQGGPYPPFTWILGSIVKHHHQKAAYCGLHYFDSDAYPPEYRDRLYMGNIHGGCVNVDVLERDGSTYVAHSAPDFLTANDAWFMPVSQKTGPDGCLYILDWYDRYHCYQDANRDPGGIDRDRGRLYRVRYRQTPPAGRFDLSKESDNQLIQRLHSPNLYFRETAQRLLVERGAPSLRSKLEKLVLDDDALRKARMHALWALVGGGPLDSTFLKQLLAHPDAGFRAWGVRAAGNARQADEAVRLKITELIDDRSADVQLQVAIAARKLAGQDPLPILFRTLTACGDDRLIPGIVWQNLNPLLEERAAEFVRLAEQANLGKSPALGKVLPRVLERQLARRGNDEATLVALLRIVLEGATTPDQVARECLNLLATKIQSGEITGDRLTGLHSALAPILRRLLDGNTQSALRFDAALLAATVNDPAGLEIVRRVLASPTEPAALRLKALETLAARQDPSVLDHIGPLFEHAKADSSAFHAQVLAALGRLRDARLAGVVLAAYPRMEPENQPKAIELLTQRPEWTRPLLRAVEENKVSAAALNVTQLRRLIAMKDPEIAKQVKAHWGTIRTDRNPEREKVVAEMRQMLRQNRGDAKAGVLVFNRICAQCHRIYGEGQDVGPDITNNGRGSFDQLLSNVFDPSLVIGEAYQATTVITSKGRSLTGLLVENNDQRVVLKLQGGKVEAIPRSDVEEFTVSPVSLMPEGLEKQMTPKEIVDLFAFLTLDRPVGDPKTKPIPGAP